MSHLRCAVLVLIERLRAAELELDELRLRNLKMIEGRNITHRVIFETQKEALATSLSAWQALPEPSRETAVPCIVHVAAGWYCTMIEEDQFDKVMTELAAMHDFISAYDSTELR